MRRDDVTTDFVLLASKFAEAEVVLGFRTRRWECFCLEARKLIPAVTQERGMVVAALMLAFVGAVEQNVLKLDGEGVRRIFSENHGDAVQAVDPNTVRYLRRLVKEEG